MFKNVSVPLSGLAFVNKDAVFVQLWADSFRPLIGVSFCKPYPLQTLILQGLKGALAYLKFNKRILSKIS